MAKPKKKDNEKKQTCLFTPSSENLEMMLNPGKIYARNCELNCGEVGNKSLPKIAELNCLSAWLWNNSGGILAFNQ